MGRIKSILEDVPKQECYFCGAKNAKLEEHHIYYGRGWRELSEKYGLKVTLCQQCHYTLHFGTNTENRKAIDDFLKRQGQRAFESKYNNINFIDVMGRNYL